MHFQLIELNALSRTSVQPGKPPQILIANAMLWAKCQNDSSVVKVILWPCDFCPHSEPHEDHVFVRVDFTSDIQTDLHHGYTLYDGT